MDEWELEFNISELTVGRPLKFAIYNPDGALIADEGTLITQDQLDQWAEQGITTACVPRRTVASTQSAPPAAAPPEAGKVAAEPTVEDVAPFDDASAALLLPYDRQALKRLDECFEQASAALLEIAHLLAADALSNCQAITQSLAAFIAEVDLDMATVLASLMGGLDAEPSEKDVELSKRCARMSVLAVVVGIKLGYSHEECQLAGVAGMLHDISLFDGTAAAVTSTYGSQRDALERYRDHPLQSASLLSYVNGISDQARHIISQVHEDMDGNGFPRGLLPHRTHRMAKLLNVVDAFLTLTSNRQFPPLPHGANLLPADAIAYLMHQSTRGKFDVESVRGLILATSLYPVGSSVLLSDNSTAIVHRGSDSPTQPIVRLDFGSRSIIDLRHSSLAIERPLATPGSSGRRIRTSELDDVLWRTDLGA